MASLSVEELLAENAALQNKIHQQARKILELEDECDLLAAENCRLLAIEARFISENKQSEKEKEKEFILESKSVFVSEIHNGVSSQISSGGYQINDLTVNTQITGVCDKSNPLSVTHACHGGVSVIVVGGADKVLRVFLRNSQIKDDGDDNVPIFVHTCSAPVLYLVASARSYNGKHNVVLGALMDGSVILVDLSQSSIVVHGM